MGDLLALRPTRTEADVKIDLPPCGQEWGPDCPRAGWLPGPHRCWTWAGWPHICRCLRCKTKGA
jgi:hypothetical protein